MTRAATIALTSLLLLAPGGARAQVETERWTVNVALGLAAVTNFTFVTPEDRGGIYAAPSLGLSYVRLGERSSVLVSASGGPRLYRNLSGFGGGQFGVAGSYGFRATPRLQLNAGQAFSRGFGSVAAVGSQILLPQIDVKSSLSSLSLSYELTPSTLASAHFDATLLRYQADLVFEGNLLPTRSPTPRDLAGFGVGGLLDPDPAFGIPESPPGPDTEASPFREDPLAAASIALLHLLLGEGVPVARLDLDTYRVGVGLAHAFSPRTRVSLNLGRRFIEYRTPDIASGRQSDASLAVSQRLGTTWGLGLSYAFARNDAQLHELSTHTFSVGLDAELEQQLSLDASVGMSYLDGPAPSSGGLTLVGGAGISRRGDRNRFNAHYTRSQHLALGFGRNLVTDVVSVGYDRVLTKRLWLGLLGAYQNSRDSLSSGFRFDSQVFGLALRRRIKRRTAIGVDLNYLRIGRGGLRPVSGVLASVFISYGRTFK